MQTTTSETRYRRPVPCPLPGKATRLVFARRIVAYFADDQHRKNLLVPGALKFLGEDTKIDVREEIPGAVEAFKEFQRAVRDLDAAGEQSASPPEAVQVLDVEEVEPVQEQPASEDEPNGDPSGNVVAEVETPTAGPQLINLGGGAMFATTQEALTYVRGWSSPRDKNPSPVGYRPRLTQTFLNGTPAGQLVSLMRDYRRYGLSAPVLTKISLFVGMTLGDQVDDTWKRYRALISRGVLPHHVQGYVGEGDEARVDLDFFRYVALRDVCGVLK